jgi:predicted nucleic acid-binding protein
MAILIDTNVLLRVVQADHASSAIASGAVDLLRRRNHTLCITQQNIVEFWAVASRPLGSNGLGLTTEQVLPEIDKLKRYFQLLPESPLQSVWERLVFHHKVSGKQVHDARLAAAMIVHGVESILTFNGPDFLRYREISVLDPASVI